MSTLIQGNELRTLLYGQRAEKSTGTLAATTVALFTVTGGVVLLTSITGYVTAEITVANSYKLQHNPTVATGATLLLCTATDLGTNNTAIGSVLSFTGPGSAILGGSNVTVQAQGLSGPIPLQAGQLESVSLGTDGAILWVVTWVPQDDGASLVAA